MTVSRPARRLAIAVLALLAFDIFEPAILSRLETARYEDATAHFRFENSDLFGIGPLVDYLREHPRGRQPRVMFFGNSVTYGYGLGVDQAVPAQFQQLVPSRKVLNVGVNSLEAGSAYLVAKATIEATDEAYLLSFITPGTDPMIPRLVPIEPADRAALSLPPAPGGLTTRVEQFLGSWRLYRDSYRLQAAMFGTSSRQFIYLNKSSWARALMAPLRAQERQIDAPPAIEAVAPLAPQMPGPERIAALRRAAEPMAVRFADLFAGRGRSLVLLQIPGYTDWAPDDDLADFNRAWHPHVRIVRVRIPRELTFDNLHFTAAGARAMAEALVQERRAFQDARR